MLGYLRSIALAPLLLASLPPLAAQQVDFTGHRVVRVYLSNIADADTLLDISDDVWSHHIVAGPVDARVTPEQFIQLQFSGLPFEVLIENIQQLIDAERGDGGVAGTWDAYMDLPAVLNYMNSLVALRPDLASSFVIGNTVEGRPITGIKITGPGPASKPGVLYFGCEHAREWITVPVTLYVADQLIRNYDSDPYLKQLVDRAEWYIIPVFNADGYVYTWSTNRLWRKNRRNNGGGAFGVDNNRNWGYQWGGEGASSTPSNETYRGPSPWSEPETVAMRDWVLNHPNIVGFLDIHSYSQLVLWPWGYSSSLTPDEPRFQALFDVLVPMIAQPYGTVFTGGAIYPALYPASGVSVDWAYGAQGILAMSFELRDTGENGFVLPANQILPSCEEMFPALLYYADEMTAAVRITYPNGRPTLLPPGVATPMQLRITANNESVNPDGATLHVRNGSSGPFISIPIIHQSGDNYTATFPPRFCGNPTEYYVTATGASGSVVTSPAGAPATVHSVPIGTKTTYFSDNFETNQGWTVQNTSVSTGAWVRVDPNGTTQNGPAQPEDDNPAGAGTMCYVTGQGPVGGAVGTADLDGGPTRLLSPTWNLAGADPIISYYRWHYSFGGVIDTMTVEVSNNNGSSWVTVETVSHTPAWTKRTFRLADYVTPTATVRLRFSVSDNPNDSITESAIDDVVVESETGCTNVALNGDANCDGTVNPFDISPFLLALSNLPAYQSTYCGGGLDNVDVNDDGTVNPFDINPFLVLLGS